MKINLHYNQKIQSIPHSKHTPSWLEKPISYYCTGKQSLLVLRSTQNTDTLCGQNTELLNVKPSGT